MGRIAAGCILCVLHSGCADEPGDPFDSFGAGGSGTASDGGGPSPPTSGNAGSTNDSGAASAATTIKFDTPDDGGADGGAMGCQKVDFLFIVDNSGSMANEQVNLAASFPGFIDAIENTLMAKDFHVMVIDSDSWWTNDGGIDNASINCNPHPACCWGQCGTNTTCNGGPCPAVPLPPVPCDATLGAGRILDRDLGMCPIDGGQRYMVDGQADLPGAFTCVATVGVDGVSNERPMEAMVESVSDGLNGPGGCNEGFLRDDAILVVTFITDEEDAAGKSAGDPPTWKQALVDAKSGNEDAVVVLGFGIDEADRLRELALSFSHGVYDDVSVPDYTPQFVDAVQVIDIACDDFVPPG